MAYKIRVLSEGFEAKRWPYYLISPIVWLLVFWVLIKNKFYALFHKKNANRLLVFDGIGKHGKVIKDNVAGWKAVDLIYNHRFGDDKTIGGVLDDFWFGNLNCQSARNRFKLAKKELEKAIIQLSTLEEVRIISLASGTGQIESEVLSKVKKADPKVQVILIDKELEAVKRAQEFISINDVEESIKVINTDVNNGICIAKQFKPHIVEMIGFLDYLAENEAIELISKVYNLLPNNGFFIASNTMPNIEMHFVKCIVGWPLLYRKSKDISNIIEKSGFTKYKIIKEPLNIQCIVVATK